MRHPLHPTGVGRAILFTREPDWLDTYLAEPLLPETRHTIVDPVELRARITAEAKQGYAVTHQEMTLGNVSIAMPLRARPGLPPAAIGIVAHEDSADEVRLVPLLRRAIAAVEQRLDAL
jgi:DNA-binding IclR family transcriptional regulator